MNDCQNQNRSVLKGWITSSQFQKESITKQTKVRKSHNIKMRVMSLVFSVFLSIYGSECWTLKHIAKRKIDAIDCWRGSPWQKGRLPIRYMDFITDLSIQNGRIYRGIEKSRQVKYNMSSQYSKPSKWLRKRIGSKKKLFMADRQFKVI